MDYYKLVEKRSVTPEKLRKTLEANGTILTLEKAEKVLDLIYKLSNLSVSETLTNFKDSRIKVDRRRFRRAKRTKK